MSAGADNIPAELLQAGGMDLASSTRTVEGLGGKGLL